MKKIILAAFVVMLTGCQAMYQPIIPRFNEQKTENILEQYHKDQKEIEEDRKTKQKADEINFLTHYKLATYKKVDYDVCRFIDHKYFANNIKIAYGHPWQYDNDKNLYFRTYCGSDLNVVWTMTPDQINQVESQETAEKTRKQQDLKRRVAEQY